MEKFYIVTNPQFLKEISNYKENRQHQKEVVRKFFKDHSIAGEIYHVRGDGFVNQPFSEWEKKNIRLYIPDNEYNNEKFGKELLKPVRLFCDSYETVRSFRANSRITKEFQDLCVKENVVINIHDVRPGDYFVETHYGGYKTSRFEYNGAQYLRIVKDNVDSITPEQDGFIEIKGSEFFTILESIENNA